MSDELSIPTHDGNRMVGLAHGRDCVVVTIEEGQSRLMEAGAILSPANARELALRLIEQAAFSERHPDE